MLPPLLGLIFAHKVWWLILYANLTGHGMLRYPTNTLGESESGLFNKWMFNSMDVENNDFPQCSEPHPVSWPNEHQKG